MAFNGKYAELQAGLLKQIITFQPWGSEPVTLSSRTADAFRAMPRHEFIRSFKLVGEADDVDVYERGTGLADEMIYSNRPLMYVDDDLNLLYASNSEPSFILHLLDLLDLKAGHRVLEVGCGTGWLLSLMSELVGTTGEVVGVELIESLAHQAVDNLFRLNVSNAAVYVGDGLTALAPLRCFDRVIFTASAFEVPVEIINSICVDGKLVLPLRNRGLTEEVYLFERDITYLRSVASRLCRFVPLQNRNNPGQSFAKKLDDDLGLSSSSIFRFSGRSSFVLTSAEIENPSVAAAQFSSFLAKTDPTFELYWLSSDECCCIKSIFGDIIGCVFGLVNREHLAAALWVEGELFTFGNRNLAQSLFVHAVSIWRDLGHPFGSDYDLEIHPGEVDASDGAWRERRDTLTYVWRPAKLNRS